MTAPNTLMVHFNGDAEKVTQVIENLRGMKEVGNAQTIDYGSSTDDSSPGYDMALVEVAEEKDIAHVQAVINREDCVDTSYVLPAYKPPGA